jgi:hypothetical protein
MSLFPKKPLYLITVTAAIAMGLAIFFLYSKQDNVVSNRDYQKNQGGRPTKTVQLKSNTSQVKSGNFNKKPPLPLPKTDDEQQEYFDNLHDQSPEIVWEQWIWLLKTDGDELNLTNTALAQVLQKNPSEQVYTDMHDMLNDSSLLLEQRASVVSLLAETATPASLNIILSALRDNATDTNLRQSLLGGIETIGDYRWDGRFHTELSPSLESAWLDLPHDEELHSALGMSIANIGATSGVDLLMNDLQRSSYASGWDSSFKAIRTVRNPEALPVFTQWYESDKILNNNGKDTLTHLIPLLKNINK